MSVPEITPGIPISRAYGAKESWFEKLGDRDIGIKLQWSTESKGNLFLFTIELSETEVWEIKFTAGVTSDKFLFQINKMLFPKDDMIAVFPSSLSWRTLKQPILVSPNTPAYHNGVAGEEAFLSSPGVWYHPGNKWTNQHPSKITGLDSGTQECAVTNQVPLITKKKLLSVLNLTS